MAARYISKHTGDSGPDSDMVSGVHAQREDDPDKDHNKNMAFVNLCKAGAGSAGLIGCLTVHLYATLYCSRRTNANMDLSLQHHLAGL